MTIDFYYNPGGTSCRIVLLAAKSIGVDLNLKEMDLFQQAHLTPEHLKLHPTDVIPSIDDDGFVLWEGRAIITYLQSKYGKNDSLYPKDPRKRAVVDQRLYFDMDLYARFHEVYNHATFTGTPPDAEKLQHANKALEFLDKFLEQSEYAAGDDLTLADLALVVDVSNLEVLKHDLSSYKNIQRWYAKIKAIAPGYKETNEVHLEIVRQIVDKLSKGQ